MTRRWRNSLVAQAERAEAREERDNLVPRPAPGAEAEHPRRVVAANGGRPLPVLRGRSAKP